MRSRGSDAAVKLQKEMPRAARPAAAAKEGEGARGRARAAGCQGGGAAKAEAAAAAAAMVEESWQKVHDQSQAEERPDAHGRA